VLHFAKAAWQKAEQADSARNGTARKLVLKPTATRCCCQLLVVDMPPSVALAVTVLLLLLLLLLCPTAVAVSC
jgi:hypothetical protein